MDALGRNGLRDMHERNLSLKDADEEQIQIANEFKDMGKKKYLF